MIDHQVPSARRVEEPAVPYTEAELRDAFLRPHQLINMVLAEYRRLFANIAQPQTLLLLIGLLFAASILYALPYGLTLSLDRAGALVAHAVPWQYAFWRVAALYLGSLLICLPSLHIFGAFVGLRHSPEHTFILSLVIPAVAGIFSFGFAPIMIFLALTMGPDSSAHTLHTMSVCFLAGSLFLGIVQQHRGLELVKLSRDNRLLIMLWQILLLYISYRMGLFLELM